MKKFNTEDELKKHQVKGGKIMLDFLTREGYALKKANRVKELISCHEVGAPKHIGKKSFSKNELEKKIVSMYNRISSEDARDIAEPFYKEALEQLREIE